MVLFLYALTVIIWGTTWIAIKFQLGPVAIELSIAYRFALAALVLFVFLHSTRRLQALQAQDHGWCVLQGLCLFCCNFLCFYHASQYVASGVIAVVFSAATLFNALNSRWFFQRALKAQVLLAAALGVSGILLLFWNDVQRIGIQGWWGLGLALLGTYSFSLGNMISARHQNRGLRPPTTNAWGMLYGTLFLSAYALAHGVSWTIPNDTRYWLALLYLAIPGSVIAFSAYLMLVGRIGPEKAAYTTVLFPVVALNISAWVENYHWNNLALLGLALVLAGNGLMFWKKAPAPLWSHKPA